MMQMFSYWSPVTELERLQDEINSLFSGVSGAVHEFPPVNLWVNNDEAIVTAEVPGLNGEDVDISVSGETLTLRGVRKPEEQKEKEEAVFARRERLFGQFTRTLQLPFVIDADKVNASYSKGVLTITLPRAESDKPRKIQIKTA